MFGIVTINAREIEIQADEVIEEDGAYKFYSEGEQLAEFVKNNIAGWFEYGDEDED